jgi:chromosome segregation ATPase
LEAKVDDLSKKLEDLKEQQVGFLLSLQSHQESHLEIDRKLVNARASGARHRAGIDKLVQEINGVHMRQHELKEEFDECSAKVSWSGGVCWYPD